MSRDSEPVVAVLRQEDLSSQAEESSELLRRARRGDRSAVDALFVRLFPWLRRRARGHLPRWARGVLDTSDVVQDVLLRSMRLIAGFESTSSIAFRAYLLRAVDHRIRDELRRVGAATSAAAWRRRRCRPPAVPLLWSSSSTQRPGSAMCPPSSG